MGACGTQGTWEGAGDTAVGRQGSARAGSCPSHGFPQVPVLWRWLQLQREVTKLISLLRLSSFLRLFLDTAI